MQNGSCQFIYTANYLAEIKLFHEGSDPGSPAASQSYLLVGILAQYSPRCYIWVSSSPGSSSVDVALQELDSFRTTHSRRHPGYRKGISIYFLQADYGVGADPYSGFSAP